KSGAGYTLAASAAGVTGATSSAFAIAPGAATRLAFSTQPATTREGAVLATVTVVAQDDWSNTATSFAGNVSIALGATPGGSPLSGTTTVAAASGVASFATLSLDKPASGYTLVATSSGLTQATSASFAITTLALLGAT